MITIIIVITFSYCNTYDDSTREKKKTKKKNHDDDDEEKENLLIGDVFSLS